MNAGWTGRTMRFLQIATDLVAVNLLIIAGAAVGLGVFGIFPALVAAGAVLAADREAGIVRTYTVAYRAHFWRANIAGVPFLGAALLLVADAAALPAITGPVGTILLVLTGAVALITLVAASVTVILLPRFTDKPLHIARFALTLTLTAPALSVGMAVTVIASAALAISYPVLVVLVALSAPLALNTKLAERALERAGVMTTPIHEGVHS